VVCNKTNLIANPYCEDTEAKKFREWEYPVEFCLECEEPEPVTVTKEVCAYTGHLAIDNCMYTEVKTFPIDQVPGPCELHDFGELPPKRTEMQVGHLGAFLGFLREAWKPEDEMNAVQQAVETFHEYAKRGVYMLDWFMWLCDNKPEHSPLNGKTPYVQYVKNGKRWFKLNEWDKRYWYLFEMWIRIHKMFGIQPCPQVFMDRYNYYPYEHNDNGVTRFWTDKAYPYQRATLRKALSIIKDVYGHGFRPYIKFINEPRHGGSDDKFHVVADFHRKLYDYEFRKFSDLKHLVIDNSGSEGGQLLLVWHMGGENGQRCPKCDRRFPDIFGKDTTQEMGRDRIGEYHSVSTIGSFEQGYNSLDAFFRSANRITRWHEDGASDCENSSGYKIGPFCFTNAQEYEATCDYVWGRQVEYNRTASPARKKYNWMALFPAETLLKIDGVFYEQYAKEYINWARIDGMLRAHIKHFG
jgi:hypothetical protein